MPSLPNLCSMPCKGEREGSMPSKGERGCIAEVATAKAGKRQRKGKRELGKARGVGCLRQPTAAYPSIAPLYFNLI
jgi:hypothetical protein